MRESTSLSEIIVVTATMIQFEGMLGRLAMQYRRSADSTNRKKIAQEYSDLVDQLIQSGAWQESPPPEDQLPSTDMPAAYYRYWRGSS